MIKNIYLYTSNKKIHDCEFQLQNIVGLNKSIKKIYDGLDVFEIDNNKMTTLLKHMCTNINFYISSINFENEIETIEECVLQQYIKNKEKNNIKSYCLYLQKEYDTEIVKLEFVYKNCMISVSKTGFITLETFKKYNRKQIIEILKQIIIIIIYNG